MLKQCWSSSTLYFLGYFMKDYGQRSSLDFHNLSDGKIGMFQEMSMACELGVQYIYFSTIHIFTSYLVAPN